jgi:adenylate cyclase
MYGPIDRRLALAKNQSLPDRVEGAALFVDISGFTALTEALARELGPQRGAEQLTVYLNRVYDALISVLHAYSGSTIGFSGDAMTCWFDGDDGRRATASALAMQQVMQQFAAVPNPSGGTISLAVKVAVAAGPARRFLVGDPSIQLIDTLAGVTLDRLAEAEHHAAKGQVVLDESAAAALEGNLKVATQVRDEEGGHVFSVISELGQPVPISPWDVLAENSLPNEKIRPFLIPAVYERLKSGMGEFLAELRPAVALFMRFIGLEYDCYECSGEDLNLFIHKVQRILTDYDGSLIQLTIGDKGSYLYAAFGAPLAHEDDARRAISAAQKLLALESDPDFKVTIQVGITRGRMRTGAYGSTTRRTYGVLGDAVNLAARLMQAAQPGQLLVTKAVTQAVDGYLWEDLGQIQVKGKSERISIFKLAGTQEISRSGTMDTHYQLPLVGRKKQLAAVADTIQQVLAGQGRVIGITGEAGVGKSRLISEAVHLARDQGMVTFIGECLSYGTNTSYLAWQPIWRSFFNLNPKDPLAKQVEALKKQLAQVDTTAVARLPLLGAVLDLPLEDNDLTRSLDAKIRKSSLEALLVDCVIQRAGLNPLDFILEDTHWIDPLSLDLLMAIGRSITSLPVMILTAYRPPIMQDSRTLQFSRLANFSQVTLEDFGPDEAEDLIRQKLKRISEANSEISAPVVQAIVKRTDGNPFYIEELVNYLHDLAIDLRDEHALDRVDLPTGLHSLILSRIDQLTENQKITIKIASVVGRLFKAAILWGAYPPIGSPEIVKKNLEALAHFELTIQDNEPELTYFFKHIVTQEVAYESLPFAMRALLHNQIGEHLEQIYSDSLGQFYDLLAFHFSHSDNQPKKREYLRKAGESAQSHYNNEAAVDYYLRLLPLLERDEKGPVLLRLGEVLVVLGRWDEAREQFQQALSLAEERGDRRALAQAQTVTGEFYRKQGRYPDALDFLEQARAGFESLNDEPGLGQVLHSAGSLSGQQGNFEAAQSYYTRSLEIRRRLHDLPRIASLLSNLGIVARQTRQYDQARSLYLESLTIRRELGDAWAIATSLSNLGNLELDLGNLAEARSRCEEALALQREVGDKYYIANVLNNLGNVLRAQGEYQKAFQAYRESLLINQVLGDGWTMAFLLEDIGLLAILEGQPDRALRLISAASALRENINAPLSPVERTRLEGYLQPVRQALSDEVQSALWEEGRKLNLAQAVDLALKLQTF